MDKILLAIFESNEEMLSQLSNHFKRNDKFEVVVCSTDGLGAMEKLKETMPDVVLTDLVLRGMDGIAILDGIRENGLDCVSIVFGGFSDDTIVHRVMSKGASYYLVKPFSPEVVERRVLECVEDKAMGAKGLSSEKRKNLDEEISSIFISIGIPPHIKGYNYLREGIKMTVMKPSIINNVTKELYPKIGDRFETSASKVERAIRHAIEVAWNRGRIDAINSVFGTRVYIGTEKPTNSEFIALVADKLILENMI